MVTVCNIVCDEVTNELVDLKIRPNSPIRLVKDITNIDTSVPTLIYGYKLAKAMFEDINPLKKVINKKYYWTYSEGESPKENWTKKFVMECIKSWFSHRSEKIKLMFGEFDYVEFTKSLHEYPLIFEGNYEIYIADWFDKKIKIWSIQKDEFEYFNIDKNQMLTEMYTILENRFITYDSLKFDFHDITNPVFVDELLFANSDKWIGIPELTDSFSNWIPITHEEVIVYYLKRSECYRKNFFLYQ